MSRPDRADRSRRWRRRSPERRPAAGDDADERLRMLESVVVNANDAVLVTEPEPIRTPGPRIVYVNEAFTRMTGWRPHEVVGRTPRRFQGPGTDPAALRRIGDALRRGRSVREELLNYRKDGSPFWVEISISPVRDERGRITHFISVQRETTERHRLEEAQARLIAILEATPDFVGTADARGRTLYVNRAGRRMTGVRDDEDVRGRHISTYHPDWAAARVLEEGVPTAIRRGAWTGETALASPTRGEIPVSQVILAHMRPDGSVAYLSTIMRDISERKRAEEDERFLSEASGRLAETLDVDATLDIMTRLVVPGRADYCLVDLIEAGGRVRRAAARHRDVAFAGLMRELRGYEPTPDRPLELASVLERGEPTLVPEVSDAWLRSIARDPMHFRILRELHPRSMMVVPLRAAGRTLGALTIVSTSLDRRYDAHDLRLAESLAGRAALAIENARLYGEARRATRVRDEVLAIVSHDLRNPLNAIGLTAESLLELAGESEERAPERAQLGIIQRATERANRLIRDLLDVARIEAGGLSVERRPEPAASAVKEAVERHRPEAEAKGLRLDDSVPDDLPTVSIDHDRIVQLASNLIGNAVKFTPAPGRVVVSGDRVDDRVRFRVADTGPGIAPEELEHIFDPFWQLHRAGGAGGAGLGLAIARAIVQAHGGRIWVESAPGEGAAFYFTLPVG